MSAPPFRGLAIECSGDRIAACVFDAAGESLAAREQESAREHAKNLLALTGAVLAEARLAPRDLDGIAIDVGPGSFTALRVGLATARGLAQPFDTRVVGVTSFAALVEGLSAPNTLVVPMIPAGRHLAYAGFYRGDPTGRLTILRGPSVGDVDATANAVREALVLCPRNVRPRFLGPGAMVARDALEARFPGSTGDGAVEGDRGPTATALARAGARLLGGASPSAPAARPLYVRAPQAVVQAQATNPFARELTFAPFSEGDLDEALVIENTVFSDPWPRQFFLEELKAPQALACAVRHRGKLAGYLLAWRLEGELHLGNFAVAPDLQRRGVGQAMLEWLIARAREAGAERITLEVRASNFAAQELYRRFGFAAVALRRGYYQDSGEDALIMLRDLRGE